MNRRTACQQETRLFNKIPDTKRLKIPTKPKTNPEADVVRKDAKGAGLCFKISNSDQQQIIKAMIDSSLESRHRKEQAELPGLFV